MATVTNKRKVLSVEKIVKVIRKILHGKKKVDVCRELRLVNSKTQTICKNSTKILVRLHRTAVFVGPCQDGMAHPQVADEGTASDMEGS